MLISIYLQRHQQLHSERMEGTKWHLLAENGIKDVSQTSRKMAL